MLKILSRFRYHIAVFFAVIGPGFITANVDNDSGGIFTYSAAGARYGYLPLWTLLPITLVLIITQEMCSRMGAATGKGLSDLIREEFGLRITFLMMALLVLVNLTNVMAEFAGVASSLELFHVSRYFSVPVAAVGVWFLAVKGNYKSVEKIFLFGCFLYVTYIISGFLVKPDWKTAAIYSVKPVLMLEPGIHLHADRHGRHHHRSLDAVLPAIRRGGEGNQRPRSMRASRVEVIVGCIMTDGDRVLHHRGLRGGDLQRQAHGHSRCRGGCGRPPALRTIRVPAVQRRLTSTLRFSRRACCRSPPHIAVCEGLGFESGVNRRMGEAPIFYVLYTLLIVLGAGVILIPNFRPGRHDLLSQVLNGMLLPFVLIPMVLLINKHDLWASGSTRAGSISFPGSRWWSSSG